MPVAIDVTPKDWTEISVLYDDGTYSVIWGRFRLNRIKSLGVRWNGAEGEKGYPSLGRNPLWYREPDFLDLPILRGLLEKHQGATPTPQIATYIKRVEVALREAESQGTGVRSCGQSLFFICPHYRGSSNSGGVPVWRNQTLSFSVDDRVRVLRIGVEPSHLDLREGILVKPFLHCRVFYSTPHRQLAR